jgi:hypothetical protein
LFFCPASAWGQSGDGVLAVHEAITTDVRAQEIDAMLSKYFRPGEPGAAIIISQHGSTSLQESVAGELSTFHLDRPLQTEPV